MKRRFNPRNSYLIGKTSSVDICCVAEHFGQIDIQDTYTKELLFLIDTSRTSLKLLQVPLAGYHLRAPNRRQNKTYLK